MATITRKLPGVQGRSANASPETRTGMACGWQEVGPGTICVREGTPIQDSVGQENLKNKLLSFSDNHLQIQ
jgi:hypothetical protein